MAQWVKNSPLPVSEGGFAELPHSPQVGVPFCDWLDVTFSPTESLSWVPSLVSSLGGSLVEVGFYQLPDGGVIKHQTGKRWQRLSISGSALSVFRAYGFMSELLAGIASHPHKVTRLDAAYDVAVDAAPVVAALWGKYRGAASELRLNVFNSVSASAVLGQRFDGVETGTFYAGNRKRNSVTARVYDKQHQAFEKLRLLIAPRVRYEVTVRTDQPTLRDVLEPAALFWHYASPALLPAPADVPVWVPGNPYVWQSDSKAVLSVEDRVLRVLHGSGDLNAAKRLCGASLDALQFLAKVLVLDLHKFAAGQGLSLGLSLVHREGGDHGL